MSFTNMHLYFEDIEVGQEWNSLGRTVTQTDIINFAGVSGDFNPIHMDHEFARSTIFQQPVAHGLLIFSMASGLGIFSPPMRTLAFMSIREWQFREPVFIGDTITAEVEILEVHKTKPVSRVGMRIVRSDGETVLEGDAWCYTATPVAAEA